MIQDLETIRATYVSVTKDFLECKTYCLAHSTICSWQVLWSLRDQMKEAKKVFVDATKKALRKRTFKPTYEELDADKEFMESFLNDASKNPELENQYFLSPEKTLENYYDNFYKKTL